MLRFYEETMIFNFVIIWMSLFSLQMTGRTRKSVIDSYISSKAMHSFEHVLFIKIKHQKVNIRKTMNKVNIAAFKCDF